MGHEPSNFAFSPRDDLEVTDECLALVRGHFSEPELVELTFIAGFLIFASRFAKAFRVAVHRRGGQNPHT